MENLKQATHDSMPLVSRLDHVEFIMKNLESRQNLAKWGSNINHNRHHHDDQVPLNMAIREAYFKGTLLERVASLEHRLFQVCLALESSSSSTGTYYGEASSSRQESKSEVSASSSLPTFNTTSTHKQEHQVLLNTSEIQGKSDKVQQERSFSHESPVKQCWKKKPNSDDKTCKSGSKKRASPSWPRFKLLGC